MGKKIFCRVETDKEKISEAGLKRILIPLENIGKTNYIFEGTVDNTNLLIEIPEFLQRNYNPRIWNSNLKNIKERIPKTYTFIIIEDRQLEFDF